jgi:hypothetical protein
LAGNPPWLQWSFLNVAPSSWLLCDVIAGYSEQEAYKRAEEWMIANGKTILQRLRVPEEFKDSLVRVCVNVPASTLHMQCNDCSERLWRALRTQDAEKLFKDSPDTLAFRALEKQWKLLKEGLAQDLIERWGHCFVAYHGPGSLGLFGFSR